jgi:hypothetical protein
MYFQLIPTFETRTRQDGEMWRFIIVVKDGGQLPSSSTLWMIYCTEYIDLVCCRVGQRSGFWKRSGMAKTEEVGRL